jgi:hypothetical protein
MWRFLSWVGLIFCLIALLIYSIILARFVSSPPPGPGAIGAVIVMLLAGIMLIPPIVGVCALLRPAGLFGAGSKTSKRGISEEKAARTTDFVRPTDEPPLNFGVLNKRLVAIGCASVVALGGVAYVASPYWATSQVATAFRTGDRDAPARRSAEPDVTTKSRAAGPPIPSTKQPDGHDQPVTNPEEMAGVVRDFQSEFAAMKMPVTIDSCRLVEQVAVGVVGGNVAHGAICRVSIARAPERDMLLCNDDGVGYFAIQAGSWVVSREWVASFVRQNCFGG